MPFSTATTLLLQIKIKIKRGGEVRAFPHADTLDAPGLRGHGDSQPGSLGSSAYVRVRVRVLASWPAGHPIAFLGIALGNQDTFVFSRYALLWCLICPFLAHRAGVRSAYILASGIPSAYERTAYLRSPNSLSPISSRILLATCRWALSGRLSLARSVLLSGGNVCCIDLPFSGKR